MSDLAVSWVAIAPSAWARRLRCGAWGVAAATGAALVSIHAFPEPAIAFAAAACTGLVAARLAHAFGAAMKAPAAWSLSSDGRIAVRHAEAVQDRAAVVFASSWFVVVRAGGQTLEIWRDATPVRAFRRLGVAARWGAARGRAGGVAGDQAGQSNDRT